MCLEAKLENSACFPVRFGASGDGFTIVVSVFQSVHPVWPFKILKGETGWELANYSLLDIVLGPVGLTGGGLPLAPPVPPAPPVGTGAAGADTGSAGAGAGASGRYSFSPEDYRQPLGPSLVSVMKMVC